MTEEKKKPTKKKCVAKRVLFNGNKKVLVGEEFTCTPALYEIFKKAKAV